MSANGLKGDTGATGATGAQGEKGDKGDDGLTPYIQNGTWWIGTTDTGVSANGLKGDQGEQGLQGATGSDGLSAYEIYKKYNPSYTGTEEEWLEAFMTGTLVEHTVTFDLNGGTGTQDFESTVTANHGKTIALTVPTRTGYTFNGWYTGETAVDGIFTTTDTVTGNLDLIAKWTINKVVVTFYDYYGDMISRQTIDYGSAATAPAVPSSVNDIPFYGWNKSFDAVKEDIEVHALYAKEIYTVSYNTDGADEIPDEGVYYGDIPTKPADPVKTGFTFAGWFLDREFTTEYNFDYALDANTTLYAKLNGDYIIITTAEELAAVANDTSETAKYVLGNDINYKGDIWTPLQEFRGTLDGNGYRIYNFSIADTNTVSGFVKINYGTIKNIVFDKFSYALENTSSAAVNAGVVASVNNGTIENCSLTNGDVKFVITKNLYENNQSASNLGGIVGKNAGTIVDCVNTVDIVLETTCKQTGRGTNIRYYCAYNNLYLGGIAGLNISSVEQSYYIGTVESQASGINNGDYANGENNIYISGLIAKNDSAGSIEQCYANVSIISNIVKGTNHPKFAGIVSENNGTLHDSYAVGSIVSNDNGYNSKLGGAIAINNGSVKNVYTSVDIQSLETTRADKTWIAPFVAQQNSTGSLVKCYGMGNINVLKSNYVGAFAGELNGSSHLCFYSDSTTLTVNGADGTPTCTVGEEKTLSELQSEDFIYNTLYWDVDIWKAVDGMNPTLKCFE